MAVRSLGIQAEERRCSSSAKHLSVEGIDDARDSYDPDSVDDRAVTWWCYDQGEGSGEELHQLPPRKCPYGMRQDLRFPACWDGKNTELVYVHSYLFMC